MIRNVVVVTAKPGTSTEQIDAVVDALAALRVPGVDLDLKAGRDLGFRPGGASFAVTADFATEEQYRIYDADPEHNRIRSELLVPLAETIQRCQFLI